MNKTLNLGLFVFCVLWFCACLRVWLSAIFVYFHKLLNKLNQYFIVILALLGSWFFLSHWLVFIIEALLFICFVYNKERRLGNFETFAIHMIKKNTYNMDSYYEIPCFVDTLCKFFDLQLLSISIARLVAGLG